MVTRDQIEALHPFGVNFYMKISFWPISYKKIIAMIRLKYERTQLMHNAPFGGFHFFEKFLNFLCRYLTPMILVDMIFRKFCFTQIFIIFWNIPVLIP
jgi:hypothetical protein